MSAIWPFIVPSAILLSPVWSLARGFSKRLKCQWNIYYFHMYSAKNQAPARRSCCLLFLCHLVTSWEADSPQVVTGAISPITFHGIASRGSNVNALWNIIAWAAKKVHIYFLDSALYLCAVLAPTSLQRLQIPFLTAVLFFLLPVGW